MDIRKLGIVAKNACTKAADAVKSKTVPFVKLHKIALSVVSAVTVMVMLMSVMMIKRNDVKVYINGGLVFETVTFESDSEKWLELSGVEVAPIDEVSVKDTDIYIKKGFYVTVTADGVDTTVAMTEGRVSDALANAGVTVNEGDIVAPEIDAFLKADMKISVSRVKTETVTETETVKHTTKKVKTNDLYEGETKVETEGENGKIEYTYSVTYTDGKETSRKLVSKKTVKEAVEEVVLVGTKVKSSFKKTSSTPTSYKKVIAMKASAYTYGEDGGNYTATGVKCRYGIVAVDPDVIPLGTKLYIESADGKYIYGEAVAGDTGGSIKGNKIDLFVNSKAECSRFGRRNVNVYIIG